MRGRGRRTGRRRGALSAKLMALHKLGAKLASDTSVEAVVRDTSRAMKDALGFDHAEIALVERRKLVTTAHSGSRAAYPSLSLNGPGVIVKAARSKKSMLVPNVRKETSYLERWKGMRSELAVPVILGRRAVGVLNVESAKPHAFDKEDQQLLETLASHVASSLGRIRFEQSLRASETKMRGILTALPDLVFEMDPKGVYTGFYAARQSDLAVPPERFLGKSMREVLPGRVASLIDGAMKKAKKTGTVATAEYQLPTLRGTVQDWEAHVSRTTGGDFVAVVRNVTASRKAEEKLRQSEERYRSLVDGMLDGSYRSTHGGRLIDVNPAFVKMFGYSSRKELLELPGISSVLYFSPEDRASVFLDTGQERVELFRMRRKDGSEIWVEDHGRYVHDQNGKVIFHEGVLRDVTERVHAEGALRESEKRNRDLIDGMLDGTYRSTHEGRFVDINPAFVRMFGYSSRQEMLDIPDIKKALYFSPEERGSHILDTGQQEVEVYRMRRKDGSEIWVEDHGRYVHDQKGKVIFHEGVLRDVTERVHAEEALRQSESRYRELVELSPTAIVVHDGKNLLYINPAAAKLLGIKDREKAVGNDVWKFLHRDSFPAVSSRVKQMLEEGRQTPLLEEKFLRVDGSVVDVEVAGMPVTWHGIPAVQIVFNDITQRKAMANELRQYSEHLQELVKERTEKLREAERMAAMGQLAAMVAHDLRNPLTGITGASYYLRKKLGPTADRRTKEMLEIIEKDVDYSNRMMTSLVEYSGEVRLNLNESNARKVVEEALMLVRIPDEVRVSNLAEGSPKVMLDEEKLVRVTVNLIHNAVEAMPQGGDLTIRSQGVPGGVELAISDTGMGMSSQTLSRIWTPFSTTKAKGMGLGLPMAKQIVEAHGGKISVTSAVGKGTTVTVTLPLKPDIRGEGTN